MAAGSFEFVNPLDILNTGTHTVQVKFVPDDAATYYQAFGTAQVTVLQGTPTINAWATASDIEYGQNLAASVLNGGDASVSGVFSFDNPTFVPALGVYTADVTFTPDDAINYITVSGTVDVTVNQASQEITWTQDLTGLEIGSVVTLNATASSGLIVTYQSENPNVAVITGNSLEIIASGIIVITASQSGDNNYEAADDVEKSLDIPVGVFTASTISGLTLYPVPAQSFVMLETGLSGQKYYALYDISGKLISDGKFDATKYELNIRKLTPGQYVIRIMQGEILLSGSFVKQ